MRALVALLVATALVSLGESAGRCSWGPAYWCQSQGTAVECDQVKYCQDSVWGPKEEVDESVECKLCSKFVTELEKIVETNNTEMDLMVQVEKICPILGPLKTMCRGFIEDNFDTLWKVVTKEMNGPEVCKLIEMCKPTATKKTKAVMDVSLSPACTLCEEAISKMRNMMADNDTAQSIENFIEKFCTILPLSAKTDCVKFVEENFKKVWEMIEKGLSSNVICKELKLCSSSLSKPKSSTPKVDVFCTVCDLVMEFAKPFVNGNNSEDEVKAELEKFCNLLPGKYSANCTNFVKEYFGWVWMFIKSEVDGGKVCGMIDSKCANSRVLSRETKLSTDVTAGLCDTCMLITHYISIFVENPDDEAEVKAGAEMLCKLLPSQNLSTECKALVDNNFDTIWKLLQQETDHGEICKQLGLCNNTSIIKTQKVTPVQQTPCDLCKLATKFLRQYVDSNTTEAEVKSAIEQVCKLLPGEIGQECTSLVDKNFDMIWKLVQEEVDGDEICMQLGLCNNTSIIKPKKATPVKQDLCDLCKLAVSFLKQYVDSNTTEAEVKDAIEQVCKLLPGDASEECSKFVNDNFDTLWKAVQMEVDSGKACADAGLCNSTFIKPNSVTLSTKPPVKEAGCEICQLLANFVKPYVDRQSDEAKVKDAVEKFCSHLPKPWGQTCMDYAATYIDQYWQMAKDEIDSGEICEKLSLCKTGQVVSKPKVKQQLQVEATPACDACELIVKFLTPFVDANSTENEVKNAVEKVCGLLPGPIGTECKSLIDGSFDLIWNMVKGEFDNDLICKQIGLCNQTAILTKQKTTLSPMYDQCDLCQATSSYMNDNNLDEVTKELVEVFLQQICKDQPEPEPGECLAYLDSNYDTIWADIKTDFATGKMCSKLGICNNSLELSSPMDYDNCDFCKAVTNSLRYGFSTNDTKFEILDYLKMVCNASSESKECLELLQNDYDSMWAKIHKDFDDGILCKKWKICELMPYGVKQVSKVADSELCTICKMVSNYIEVFMSKSSSEDEVKNALQSFCAKIESSECTELLNDYFDLIWMVVKGEMNKDELCFQAGICNSTVAKTPVKLDISPVQTFKSPEASVECVVCEFVMKQLDSILGKNATEAAIEAALDKVCSLLPSTIESLCEDFVKQYAPEIVQLLVEGLDPQEVCTKIGLCQSKAPSVIKQVEASVECILCEFVMKEVDSILSGNTSQAAVVAALDKVCDILPASIKTECESLVKQYAPQIIELLVEGLSPQQVCTEIGLCQSKALTMTKQIGGETLCSLCKFIAKEAEEILAKNGTENDIVAFVKELCSILPKDSNFSKECYQFAEVYLKLILSEVAQQISPLEICSTIKLCTTESTVAAKSKIASGPSCVVCEFVMKELENILSSNASQAEVEAALEKVCNLLPATIRKECDSFVQTYAPMVIKLIVNNVIPKQICTTLGLCTSSSPRVKVKSKPGCDICELVMKEVQKWISNIRTEAEIEAALEKVCGILPSTLRKECAFFVETYGPEAIEALVNYADPDKVCTLVIKLCPSQALKKVKSGPECVLCEFILKEVDSALSNNATEAEIVATVEKACTLLPSTVRKECDMFIETYAPEIIKHLVNDLNPEQVCTIVKLCMSSQAPQKQVESAPSCALCEFAMKELEDMLTDNATEAQIEAALEKVCSFLPSTIQSECDSLIEMYTPKIINALVNKDTPKEVCTIIKLCDNSSKAIEKVESGPLCAICEYVMEKLVDMLPLNATENDIVNALDKVCSVLPKTLTSECDDLIKKYGKIILEELIKGGAPKLVCTVIHLCLGTDSQYSSKAPLLTDPKSGKLDDCFICKEVLTLVKSMISSKAAQKDIEVALEDACRLLPKEISDECKDIVDQFEPQIAQLIEEEIDPETLCKDVKLCKTRNSKKATTLLMNPWMKMARSKA